MELLRKLLEGEVKGRRRKNVVQARSFAEEMYEVLRSSYEARPIASLDFLEKTARLVQEHT